MRFDPMRAVPRHALLSLALLLLAAAPIARAAVPPPAGATLSLQQLVTEVVQNNPEIRAARREMEAARQRVAPAGALDDPMLEVGVVNWPADSFSFRREDMTMKMIGLAQRFPYPGKRSLRRDVAARDAESAGHGYRETVNRVVREAKIAYYDLALAIETARLVERNRLVLEQFLKLAEQRYAVGLGTQADVLKAQTQLSKMLDELIRLGRERPALEAELVRALGRGAAGPAIVPEPLALRETLLVAAELIERGERERPQLLALRSLIARAEKGLELAHKDAYPDFDVRLSYGQRENMPDGTRRSDMVNLTVAINLPVWRESKITPRIAEARAMHEQALDLYQAQRNELATKLRQQLAAAEQNLRSARLYENDILPQARLTVEAALAAYRVNRVDFMALLDSQMAVFNYEVAHAAAVAGYNKALAEIEWLTGRPPQ
ncbi:MAG TPA: TolC family protein [Burkholderiales bacterium]|nr:TolC family protein [Burkholderiales bacterium]